MENLIKLYENHFILQLLLDVVVENCSWSPFESEQIRIPSWPAICWLRRDLRRVVGDLFIDCVPSTSPDSLPDNEDADEDEQDAGEEVWSWLAEEIEEGNESWGGVLTSDGVEAFEIEEDPSEEDEELPPEFICMGWRTVEDLIDRGFGFEGVAIAAAAACRALGAILTRYDFARGPRPSNIVGPSFSCFRKWRSRLVCCPKQRSQSGHR